MTMLDSLLAIRYVRCHTIIRPLGFHFVPDGLSEKIKKSSTINNKMQSDKSKPEPIERLEGFTLLELLIVMSIIVVLMGILLP